MSEPTNAARADRARRTLEAYSEVINPDDDGESANTAAVDLVADLAHLLGTEFPDVVAMAMRHYNAERAEVGVRLCDTCGDGEDLHGAPGAACSRCSCTGFVAEVLS